MKKNSFNNIDTLFALWCGLFCIYKVCYEQS